MLHGENAAFVQLKPDGFLMNRGLCIHRQNQFDHKSADRIMQANLSD
jgi:hypothetical protein